MKPNYFFLFTCCLAFLISSCQKEEETYCIDIEFLRGKWEGSFDQYSSYEYPMVMEVTEIDGCNFSGFLEWPTLRNSITTMEGYHRNDTIYWTEPELLQGSGILLDGHYVSIFSSTRTINGFYYMPKNINMEVGAFTLSKIR
jgi:hypothetical protein